MKYILSILIQFLVLNTIATTYYVSTTGNNGTAVPGNAGLPFATLQYIFTNYDLNTNDVISLAAGTYTEKGIAPTSDDNGFIIQGAALSGGVPTTIFDSDQTERWMTLGNSNNTGITISRLEIKDYKPSSGGSLTGAGGAIYIPSADVALLNIYDCEFDNCDVNASSFNNPGGAIYFFNGNLSNSFTLNIKRSSFHGCDAIGLEGGALYVQDYDEVNVNIERSIFYNNTVTGPGITGYAIEIVASNTNTSELNMTNCLIYNNSTNSNGGGAIHNGSNIQLTMYNCTVYGNTCVGCATSAGLYNQDYAYLYNSIFWNNTTEDFYDGATGNDYYCVYQSQSGFASTSPSNSDPLFVNTATNDFHLQSSSPAIDYGQVAGAPTDDLDGAARYSNPDAGCYEEDPCAASISDALNGGVYYIGPTGDWTSITAALPFIKSCMVGTTTLELQAAYTDAVETYPLDFGDMPAGMSATFYLTIRPETATAVSFDGSSTNTLFNLRGSKYVYIDGRAGGAGTTKYITIDNNSTATGGSAVKFSDDASNNKIRYCTLKANYGDNSETTPTMGIVHFADGEMAGTGNSDNTIEYCIIDGNASMAAPDVADGVAEVGIYSNSSTYPYNEDNLIDNCEIRNIFIGRVNRRKTRGIYLLGGSTSWDFTNNKFYDEVARTSSGWNTWHYSMQIMSGDDYNITDNIFGGNDASQTGNWQWSEDPVDVSLEYSYFGIYGDFDVNNTTYIRRNQFKKFEITTNYDPDADFACIYTLEGKLEIGTGTGNGNLIGDTTINVNSATPSIYINDDGASAGKPEIRGMYITSSDNVTITNNAVGGIRTSGTAGSYEVDFIGIYSKGTGNFTISNNFIGGVNTANNIGIGQATSTTAPHIADGIYNSSTGTITISNNKISNISIYSTSVAEWNGISDGAGGDGSSISNNVIYEFNNPSTGNVSTEIRGIYINSNNSYTISNNVIYNISGEIGTIYGIQHEGNPLGKSVTISGNTIGSTTAQNIQNTSSSGQIEGIRIDQQGNYTVSNNTIQNLHTTTGSSKIYGIYALSAGTVNISNNVLKNFTRTGATSGSATIAGIKLFENFASSVIEKNIMTGYSTQSTSGGTIYGIHNANSSGDLTAGTALYYNNLFICNNGGYTNNCKIYGYYTAAAPYDTWYHNTFYIYGNDAQTGWDASGCIFHWNATSDRIQAIKNNIFLNNRTSGYGYSIYIGGSSVVVNTAGNIDYNYYGSVSNLAYFAYNGSNRTAITFNSSSRAYGGLNSLYYNNDGDAGDNTSLITVGLDGYLADADYTSVIVRGADISAVGDDLYFETSYRAGTEKGYMGCTDEAGNYWDGSESIDWETAANWSKNVVPTSTDNAVIPAQAQYGFTATIDEATAVCKNLKMQSDAQLIVQSGKLTVSGNITDATGTEIQFDGGELEVSSGNVTLNGLIDMNSGTFDVNGEFNITANTTTEISGGTIECTGNWNGGAASGFTATGGTVSLNGSSAVAVDMHASANFYNLAIDGSDTRTLSAATDINGSLLFNSGTLNAAGFNIELAKDLVYAGGAFTHNNNTMIFDGAAQQNINVTTDGGTTPQAASVSFYNITASGSDVRIYVDVDTYYFGIANDLNISGTLKYIEK